MILVYYELTNMCRSYQDFNVMNSASNPAENNILLTNDKKIRGYRTKRRAYTGIEPVTSRTLSENHTTRPAGLVSILSSNLLPLPTLISFPDSSIHTPSDSLSHLISITQPLPHNDQHSSHPPILFYVSDVLVPSHLLQTPHSPATQSNYSVDSR